MSKAKRPPKSASVSDQLRWYMRASGISGLQLQRELGIHQTQLSRFLKGERGLTLATLDRLCKRFKLRLVPDRR